VIDRLQVGGQAAAKMLPSPFFSIRERVMSGSTGVIGSSRWWVAHSERRDSKTRTHPVFAPEWSPSVKDAM
jgi:hypothetical protein